MSKDILRMLVDLRNQQVQKARIQLGSRLDALARGSDSDPDGRQQQLTAYWFQRFEEIEGELNKEIALEVREEQIFPQLTSVKGIGPSLAAEMVSMIDIERAGTISALWRYAGQAVVDGAAEKPVKGEKLHYNKRLKVTMFKVASSFLRADSPYRRVYDAAREDYESRADWSPLRRHRAACRKMVKVFLAHLWLRWREIEGLPVSEPYAQGVLGHDHYISPEECGWNEAR